MTTATETTATAPAVVAAPTTSIAEYSATEVGLIALEARLAGIAYDVKTKDGLEAAKKDRKEVKDLRVGLEKLRVETKAPVLALGKKIDAEAERITARLAAPEKPIDDQIKAEEKRQEQEKAERAAKEAQRVAGIRSKIGDIVRAPTVMIRATSQEVEAEVARVEAIAIDVFGFGEFEDEARAAKNDAIASLKTIHRLKLDQEAANAAAAALAAEREALTKERDEAAKERAELEKLRASTVVDPETAPVGESAILEKARAQFVATPVAPHQAGSGPTLPSTRGPWRTVGPGGRSFDTTWEAHDEEAGSSSYVPIVDAHGRVIALVVSSHAEPFADVRRTFSGDRYLITAAPMLLEELKRLVDSFTPENVEAARFAIELATKAPR